MKKVQVWLALALVVVFAVTMGCSGAQTREENPIPDWYNNPKDGCGVGSRDMRGSRSLARDAAVQRARQDLAAQLEVLVQGMIEDFEEEGGDDGLGFAADLTTMTRRGLVDQSLVGTKPRTELVAGEYFAEVCLDADAFAGSLEKMSQLSAAKKAALVRHARSAFSRMDERIEKEREE